MSSKEIPFNPSAGRVWRLLTLAGLAVVLAGCGQIPLEENAPARFDLSGHWVQADNPRQPGAGGEREAAGSAERNGRSGGMPPAGRRQGSGPPGGRSGGSMAGMASGFIAQDFPLLVAREMRIEQDARSMGIEYARGSYRDVSWGERRRGIWEVRAGWHEGALHIYSEASDISAAEIWQLSADGQRLDISISVKGNRNQEFQRAFTRSSAL